MWNEFSKVMFSVVLRASINRVRVFWQEFIFFIAISTDRVCQGDLCYRWLGNCLTVTWVNMSVRFNNLYPWGYVNFHPAAEDKTSNLIIEARAIQEVCCAAFLETEQKGNCKCHQLLHRAQWSDKTGTCTSTCPRSSLGFYINISLLS